MIGMGSSGFGGLNPRQGPMPVLGGGKPPMAGGGAPFSNGPMPGPAQQKPSISESAPSATLTTPAPASSMPYGQANDPGAYGAPGASPSSPLGMWQAWLNSMGPYLAQQPNAQPSQESGGLSSLAPGSTSTPAGQGVGGYGMGDVPWMNNRGFQLLRSQ